MLLRIQDTDIINNQGITNKINKLKRENKKSIIIEEQTKGNKYLTRCMFFSYIDHRSNYLQSKKDALTIIFTSLLPQS